MNDVQNWIMGHIIRRYHPVDGLLLCGGGQGRGGAHLWPDK